MSFTGEESFEINCHGSEIIEHYIKTPYGVWTDLHMGHRISKSLSQWQDQSAKPSL